MGDDELDSYRRKIDELDERIQALISERASYAQKVGRVKDQRKDSNFYRPEREAQILRNVRARNGGPLADEAIVRVFREIMSACLALERPLRIAYLGPEGTYTQGAAQKQFGDAASFQSLDTIAGVFREVEADRADYGVVPVENSTEGVVSHTLDMFMRSNLSISGDVEMAIHHQLMARQPDRSGIKRVCAHQQALAQCREWLDVNLPQAERVAVSSNAEAARMAVEDGTLAAIASEAAAERYGLTLIARNVEDDPNNTTRFLVIGKQNVPASGYDKTSLMVAVHNQAGALYRLLEPFARHGVSMTRIESRPSRQSKWDYVFFVDIEGHVSDERVAAALAELKKEAAQLKVLGSYPRAPI